MNLITHKDLKPRSEYPRTYDNNGYLKFIEVSRVEIEELISIGQVWETVKFLSANNMYYARFDITLGILATKIAKRILTKDELNTLEENPNLKKENSALSKETYNRLAEYIFYLYKDFQKQGWANDRLVNKRNEYWDGNRKKSYNELTYSLQATEEGKNIRL
jgi:hypothetical protein